MINLELYRIFTIVAREENLTRASEILHISQPAVTKHIKNLENEFNMQLFKRSKHGMLLNANGKKLYLQIKDAIDVLSKSEDLFHLHKDIKFGVHVNMPSSIYNKGISKYYEENTPVINIHRLNATNLFSALEKQEIDLAFSKEYSTELYDTNQIKFIEIGELHDVFVVNPKSKYLKKKLSKKDLRKTTIYTLKKFSSAYQNLIKALEYTPKDNIKIENVDYTGIIELIKVRDIIAVITKEYIEEKLEKKELCLLDVGFTLEPAKYGVYYNVNNQDKELENFIKTLVDNCKV